MSKGRGVEDRAGNAAAEAGFHNRRSGPPGPGGRGQGRGRPGRGFHNRGPPQMDPKPERGRRPQARSGRPAPPSRGRTCQAHATPAAGAPSALAEAARAGRPRPPAGRGARLRRRSCGPADHCGPAAGQQEAAARRRRHGLAEAAARPPGGPGRQRADSEAGAAAPRPWTGGSP